jgi:hypothetical protein
MRSFVGHNNDESPRNSDRARWAASAVWKFTEVTSISEDLQSDPETVLADLLANLMHWCDAPQTESGPTEALDFESALKRARAHYQQENAEEQSGWPEDPHAQ